MEDNKSQKRHGKVADLMPAAWDRTSFGLASEIRGFLASIKDEGSSIDSGGGDGTGDLWVTVGGVEYFISIRRSNNQLMKDGKPIPNL